ncbi:MAG: 1-deoxy-D-xylulose-5-phosphate synthase [Capnocytophaga sp.]|nr:1-deoxy-D-xylulose-5-phosphate synthase [Capnocytophaga sp.]
MKSLLSHIQTPAELRCIAQKELPQLASELRQTIIDVVSVKEGHLGASLGTVELTIALHYVFNTPDDILIWDVGHQAYGHKLLTGRQDDFANMRQQGGISGFPKRDESPYDAFGTGHSSTSISAALGMAIASRLNGHPLRNHIAVIGDASIVSGMAFEALNHAGATDANLLIILNDNNMSIDPSVGAFKQYLNGLNVSQENIESFFTDLNINYIGCVDGHDIECLIKAMEVAKEQQGVRLLHVKTTKGKGLRQAENDQVTYHAPGRFDRITGERFPASDQKRTKYQEVFGRALLELASQNPKIVAVTPAMPSGSGLTEMMKVFPKRVWDVGIAEQHAVTFAAGLATQGFVPYCVIYSTFLQRAYDQLIHDVALQCIPVIFCIDRAGLVGEDGATHHGVFDMAFLRIIPNLIIASPRNAAVLRNTLYTAQLGLDMPIAIRYPRGSVPSDEHSPVWEKIHFGKGECLKEGSHYAVLSIGVIAENVTFAIKSLPNHDKYAHYDMGYVKPLDTSLLHSIFARSERIYTVEEGCLTGGFGSAVSEFATQNGYAVPIEIIAIDDAFVSHGTVLELRESAGLSVEKIANRIKI